MRGATRAHGVRRILIACGASVLAVAAVVVAPAGGQQSSSLVLHQLASLEGSAVDAVISEHPDQILELLNSLPRQAAREWPALPAAARSRLERDLPSLVGNLDGVSYTVRDRANRRALTEQLAAARAAVRTHPSGQAGLLSLAAYTAISAALHAKTHPSRHLIEFVPGVRPTAAIAVGNPETASMVTWAVPGMGTYATDMQLWALAAQNLWGSQRDAAAPADHAVIAWMGYVVPPVGIDAALGEYATRGAPELTEAIQGLAASRSHDAPTLNVVAHSYGTTMAADALADTPLGVSTFVMLGSAGVEERIPTAAALHAGAVFAGEAAADAEAGLGRASRSDPRSPGFGAHVLPVDGDRAAGLAAVTGHAPILHSAYNDDIRSAVWTAIPAPQDRQKAFLAHLAEHGYLDVGTQSLREVGLVTAVARAPVPAPGGTLAGWEGPP
ncbi:alpha/beta hydrolase [Leifsonia sp. PS1209]|uniref:alpha/beta hydrolase n=1 Tax=Leifsonia sp. PS1209 TaxID=2724914 RepID=UPI001442B63C|nr:alpha/beta hydrolase [Leifsonia sp. PS1209]QIZ99785.1 hypothetical protein HF024_15570 [Leifsonia sp. PS1209]